jgi:hypothetical protein
VSLGESHKSWGCTDFSFEYVANPNAREDGYIAWVSDGVQSWTVKADATAANPRTEVGRRIIPEEPLAIIFNLGMVSHVS